MARPWLRCERCGEPFAMTCAHKRFCSRRCQIAAYHARHAGSAAAGFVLRLIAERPSFVTVARLLQSPRGRGPCVYCGVPTFGPTCLDHADLPALDPYYNEARAGAVTERKL